MKALLVIDIQNDFCEGGSLSVEGAKEIIPYVNSLMNKYSLVVATKDWHPLNHSSFLSNNPETGIWPNHCIKGSEGAKLHKEIDLESIDFIFSKGANPLVDSYSGFYENNKTTSTGLGEFLKLKGITEVLIVGLALDYCVKATALDALKFGLKVSVDLKGTRAVNKNDGDDSRAIAFLKENGVTILN
jgi:nicotinamidase/pyrazinamidase